MHQHAVSTSNTQVDVLIIAKPNTSPDELVTSAATCLERLKDAIDKVGGLSQGLHMHAYMHALYIYTITLRTCAEDYSGAAANI